ncbi:hypothetical protein SA2876_09040 [Aggregatibacter actinomycetemcomitans serotype e str. SA2876]|nr:hypothetical protein [Aggregatibacter actinomycetemcomitans]KYK74006.1 hypothetical protein SA2876_09040 [Aggregatibacter actinomycetemcomitans serotype e str. SA2876]
MPASLWISTAYVHPSSETDRFVALLAFAESRDAFEQLVKSTFHAQNIPYYYQLAPLVEHRLSPFQSMVKERYLARSAKVLSAVY